MSTTADDRTELISELINLLSGPVSTGIRAAGQMNQRRIDLHQQLEEAAAEFKRMAKVAQRMVALLDEIEGPIREAIPQISRASRVLGEILDEAPDDIGARLASTVAGLNGLVEGLGPMAMMAQGMFGSRPTAAAAPAPAAKAPAKKAAAKKATAKKAPAKKAAAKKAPAKKVAAKKASAQRSR
jgi:hypothetical protein